MKQVTGIIRRIDDLGRIVIPKELRRQLKIKEGQPFEISTTKNGFVLNVYRPKISKKEIATEWSTYSTLPEKISPSARISFAVEDRHTDVWRVRGDAIEKDGTQYHYQLYIDINSGECTLTEL